MAHTIKDSKKLLDRIKRIRGQVDAVERALEEGGDCSQVLQYIAACRGAMNGLMSEVVAGHIRHHVIGKSINRSQIDAAEEVIALVKSYLK